MGLLAVACGAAVSTVHRPQPQLGVGAVCAGALVTPVQFGYALGILLLVPLGGEGKPCRCAG